MTLAVPRALPHTRGRGRGGDARPRTALAQGATWARSPSPWRRSGSSSMPGYSRSRRTWRCVPSRSLFQSPALSHPPIFSLTAPVPFFDSPIHRRWRRAGSNSNGSGSCAIGCAPSSPRTCGATPSSRRASTCSNAGSTSSRDASASLAWRTLTCWTTATNDGSWRRRRIISAPRTGGACTCSRSSAARDAKTRWTRTPIRTSSIPRHSRAPNAPS